MHSALAISFFCGPLALVSCGTLKPDVNVYGPYRLSLSDVREIERLLPAAGVRRPIYSIQTLTSDRARISCGPVDARPQNPGQMIEVIATRSRGHWLLDKASIEKRQPIWLD